MKSRPVIERIQEKIQKRSACWIFTGQKDRQGYGRIKVGGKYGKPMQVHRVVFEHYHGPIKDLLVCHTCDNCSCCNPDHLFLGTHQDNMDDMVRKKRRNNPFGERSYRHKLTSKEVALIRKDSRSGIVLAKLFNTSKSNISMIRNNKTRIQG